jgi:hypothetical protein
MEVDPSSPSSRSESTAAPLPPAQQEVGVFIPPSHPTHFNITDDFTYYGAGSMVSMDTEEVVNLLDEAADLASAGHAFPFADFAEFLATVHQPVRPFDIFYFTLLFLMY